MRSNRKDSPDFQMDSGGFIRSAKLMEERVKSFKKYPFSIPAVKSMGTLALHPKVTFLVGENGSGKSTLVEAIAIAVGFNAEGGSRNFNFATRSTNSELHEALQITRGAQREQDGFFLRAESLYNVASNIDDLGVSGYGGTSLHHQSHGESFLALVRNRFRGEGFYILDEPESALSPARQLSLLSAIHHLVEHTHSQFLIATHSPILMAYPGAQIYYLSAAGIAPINYEETEHFQLTRDFLLNRESYLHHLFNNPE